MVGVVLGSRSNHHVLRPQEHPSAPQEHPKSTPRAAQEHPKSTQEHPKSSPSAPQQQPKSTPGAPKSTPTRNQQIQGFCVVPRVVHFQWTCALSSTDSSLERQGFLQGFVTYQSFLRVLALKLLCRIQDFPANIKKRRVGTHRK